MNRQVLWKLSVIIPEQLDEAVGEVLGTWFSQPASSYTDRETSRTTVSVYLATKPAWSKQERARLADALGQIVGQQTGRPVRITLTRLRAENWAESWKRHFKPLEIGTKLLIRPSWSRRRPRRGQVEIVLDPGLSFGTGQHPTTSFCLRQLARHHQRRQSQSFLDIGTGSGILAISAAKLGYDLVHGFDIDADAVRVARANARLNKASNKIRFRQSDLASVPRSTGRYSVVCANLTSDLLLAQRERIVSHLLSGGLLVLSGILKEEFAGVQSAYEAAGLRLVASRTQGEWRSGSFLSKQPRMDTKPTS